MTHSKSLFNLQIAAYDILREIDGCNNTKDEENGGGGVVRLGGGGA